MHIIKDRVILSVITSSNDWRYVSYPSMCDGYKVMFKYNSLNDYLNDVSEKILKEWKDFQDFLKNIKDQEIIDQNDNMVSYVRDYIHWGNHDLYKTYSTKDKAIQRLEKYIKNHEFYSEILHLENEVNPEYVDINTFLNHICNGGKGYFYCYMVSIHKINIDMPLNIKYELENMAHSSTTATDYIRFRTVLD